MFVAGVAGLAWLVVVHPAAAQVNPDDVAEPNEQLLQLRQELRQPMPQIVLWRINEENRLERTPLPQGLRPRAFQELQPVLWLREESLAVALEMTSSQRTAVDEFARKLTDWSISVNSLLDGSSLSQETSEWAHRAEALIERSKELSDQYGDLLLPHQVDLLSMIRLRKTAVDQGLAAALKGELGEQFLRLDELWHGAPTLLLHDGASYVTSPEIDEEAKRESADRNEVGR